ncbi:MAG: DNA repair protein RecN [Coraliomargaritaceae bacterium]
MLQYIKIENLALLSEVTLEFEAGFTAVTGETGAGKSVLLGALSLLAGARTDKTWIRQKADCLQVEAALFFEESAVMDTVLESHGLPLCEEGVLVLRRSIHRSKMPRVQINGAMATLAQLQALGEHWIDFHGPGEPQKLFQERRQLEMLDAYAGNLENLAAYQAVFAEWKEACSAIEAIETGDRLDADEIEFLKKQLAKIDALEVSESSIDQLEREYTRMSQAQELTSMAAESSAALSGESGACDRLREVSGQLVALVALDPDSESLLERVRSLQIEAEDIAQELDRLADSLEFEPEAVEAVNERMNLWQELRRKYGGSVAAVLHKREELSRKLSMQGDVEGTLARARDSEAKIRKRLTDQAAVLRKVREKSASALAKRAAGLLEALGFKKALLEIAVVDESELREYGNCRCRFLFSPNAGQELLALNKIASSGETARVMLALKTVLAESDATPLLVFDEVDANVGGEVGRAVGAELKRLAEGHQVLCVTHLPQVASLARNHFLVSKMQDDASTSVSIGPIHDNAKTRLGELARMLGDRDSPSAQAHAKELLAVD